MSTAVVPRQETGRFLKLSATFYAGSAHTIESFLAEAGLCWPEMTIGQAELLLKKVSENFLEDH
jgi:hypothetical protein